jgi:hypothetical protein
MQHPKKIPKLTTDINSYEICYATIGEIKETTKYLGTFNIKNFKFYLYVCSSPSKS